MPKIVCSRCLCEFNHAIDLAFGGVCPQCRQIEKMGEMNEQNQRRHEQAEYQRQEEAEDRRREEQEAYDALPDCLYCGKKFSNDKFFDYCSKRCMYDDIGRDAADEYLEEKEQEREELEAEAEEQQNEFMRQVQQQIKNKEEKERLALAKEITDYFYQFKSTSTHDCKKQVLSLDSEDMHALASAVEKEIEGKGYISTLVCLAIVVVIIGGILLGLSFSLDDKGLRVNLATVGGIVAFCGLTLWITIGFMKVLARCGLLSSHKQHPLNRSMERIYCKPDNKDGSTYEGTFSFEP